jgi:hypothetical protein|tara:strand:- start:37 stop:504 length:468 start_codon:yes stop_codon:yes gene_type:complete
MAAIGMIKIEIDLRFPRKINKYLNLDIFMEQLDFYTFYQNYKDFNFDDKFDDEFKTMEYQMFNKIFDSILENAEKKEELEEVEKAAEDNEGLIKNLQVTKKKKAEAEAETKILINNLIKNLKFLKNNNNKNDEFKISLSAFFRFFTNQFYLHSNT